MAPDTASTLFPDRPIRPLPKRRLRERLSPDVADTIQYPPAPEVSSPLFYYPCSPKDRELQHPGVVNRERAGYQVDGSHGGPRFQNDKDDAGARRVSHERVPMPRAGRSLAKQESGRHATPKLPPSTSSSADGYDSFENTNNKKKRKIPAAGDMSLNSGHSLNDISSGHAGFSIQGGVTEQSGVGVGAGSTSTGYYSSTNGTNNGNNLSSPAGMSGPGRGRYGRSRNGRSPLRTLSDASSNWAGRNGKLRPPQWAGTAPQHQTGKTSGIISSAIANANAEKTPTSNGQENVSLLQPQPNKSTPASTQFTFTCGSQVPSNLAWPGSDPRYLPQPQPQPATAQWQETRGHPDQPNITHPNMPGQASSKSPKYDGQQGTNVPQQQPRKKQSARRKLKKELEDQARARRREQTIWNTENQPKDIYICPFCEYESVNGQKPKFLIRAFEMKERKRRLEAQRGQQLLEKAKARGRKGKKGKAPAKNNGAVDNAAQAGQHVPPPDANLGEGTRSEEYDDNGEACYEEDGASYDDGPYEDEGSYDDGDEADVPDLVQVQEVKSGNVSEVQHRQRGPRNRSAAVDDVADTGQGAAAWDRRNTGRDRGEPSKQTQPGDADVVMRGGSMEKGKKGKKKVQGRRSKRQASREWETEIDKADADDEGESDYEMLYFATGHTLSKRAATLMQAFWKEIGIEDCSLPPLMGEEEGE